MNELSCILLVEDEPDHARIIMRALIKSGHSQEYIVWCKDGQEALDYIASAAQSRKRYPHLILLDLKMPMKNGMEVLEELRQNSGIRQVPIVMLTTDANPDTIQRALEKGANDYIVKPIRFNDFISKVEQTGLYWETISDAGIPLKDL